MGFPLLLFLIGGIDSGALQKNVNEAVEGLRAKGITAVGAVCHISDAQQRKSLIETAVKVSVGFFGKGVSVFQKCYITLSDSSSCC